MPNPDDNKKQEIETGVTKPKYKTEVFREHVEIFSQDSVIEVDIKKKDIELIKLSLKKKADTND